MPAEAIDPEGVDHLVDRLGRLARPARTPILHLPSRWPWAPAWLQLWNQVIGHSPPVAA